MTITASVTDDISIHADVMSAFTGHSQTFQNEIDALRAVCVGESSMVATAESTSDALCAARSLQLPSLHGMRKSIFSTLHTTGLLMCGTLVHRASRCCPIYHSRTKDVGLKYTSCCHSLAWDFFSHSLPYLSSEYHQPVAFRTSPATIIFLGKNTSSSVVSTRLLQRAVTLTVFAFVQGPVPCKWQRTTSSEQIQYEQECTVHVLSPEPLPLLPLF